jgi:hypothetical protein
MAVARHAKPADTFVLFIAGHGVHDGDSAATYYYLTHNADKNNLKGTCANFELIEDLLQGIAPRNKLFLMDTCESGEVDEETTVKAQAIAGARGIKARTTRAFETSVRTDNKPAPRNFLFQKDRYISTTSRRRGHCFSSSKGANFPRMRHDSERLFHESHHRCIDRHSGRHPLDRRAQKSHRANAKNGDLQHLPMRIISKLVSVVWFDRLTNR